MIAFIILFTVGYGTLVHQTRRFVYTRFGSGWREIISYVIGVLCVFPAFILVLWTMLNDLNDNDFVTKKQALTLAALAFFMGFGPFGLGTFLGWVSDGSNGDRLE